MPWMTARIRIVAMAATFGLTCFLNNGVSPKRGGLLGYGRLDPARRPIRRQNDFTACPPWASVPDQGEVASPARAGGHPAGPEEGRGFHPAAAHPLPPRHRRLVRGTPPSLRAERADQERGLGVSAGVSCLGRQAAGVIR